MDTQLEKYLNLISNAQSPSDVRGIIESAKKLYINHSYLEQIESAGYNRIKELE